MTGSHIDTVRTGGRYDGNYGVLAGLEVVRALNEAKVTTRRPIAVAFFTNEEGARFQPDMMGSLVYAGGLGLNEAYAATDKDGVAVGDELRRIGYLGADQAGRAEAARLRRAAYRAGPDPRRGEGADRRGRERAGHLVDRVHGDRRLQPCRHDADAAAARRGLSRRLGQSLRARARARDGRRPGRHGGRAVAAAQPDQRRAQPRGVHRRPAQHRRGEAQGGRGARRGPHRRSRRGRARRGRGQGAGALRAGDLRRRVWSIASSITPARSSSRRGACPRAPATMRR